MKKAPYPPKDRAQTTIRLPTELKEQLQQEADEKGLNLRDLIVFILWGSLNQASFQE